MKRWVTLAGLAAALLLAAGCGSSDVTNVPDSVAPGSARFLASAATKSTATPSMKTDLTVTMLSSQLPGGRMELSATGALDNQNHRMSMRLDMSKLVAGRRFRPGARVIVTITALNRIAQVSIIAIRSDKAPNYSKLCVPPGANSPAACHR